MKGSLTIRPTYIDKMTVLIHHYSAVFWYNIKTFINKSSSAASEFAQAELREMYERIKRSKYITKQ